jgi:hypothetical protein
MSLLSHTKQQKLKHVRRQTEGMERAFAEQSIEAVLSECRHAAAMALER